MKKCFVFSLVFFFFANILTGADYYWIGGAGNWSDISHWATTSGGAVTHDVVPSAEDDVYFDANSFTAPNQTVVVNTDIIFCKNMDWSAATNQPVFQAGSERTLNIYGELLLITDMTFDFGGDVRFRSATPTTRIQTQGFTLGRSVYFEGPGGWILEDALLVDSLFMLRDGDLNTNDQALNCQYFYVDIENRASLALGASSITVSGENIYTTKEGEFFTYEPVNINDNWTGLNIDPGTSRMELTAREIGFAISGTEGMRLGDVFFSNPDGFAVLSLLSTNQTQFDELHFAGHATISWTLHANRLILSPGKFYDFQGGTTYRFNEITAPGTCVEQIAVIGRSENGPAVFYSDNSAIDIDYTSLQNVHAQGTAIFTASNSADLGNNDGWNFPPRLNPNLYWVGGSGNWDDPAHWSFSSGGSGGACIPSGADNVFFDEQSFSAPGQTVTINIENAYCRDMTWTGAGFMPEFSGEDDKTIHFYGSLTFIPEINFNYRGRFDFDATTAGHTITSGNHFFTGDVRFNGLGGEWTLQDALQTTVTIWLDHGSLITNDQFVTCNFFNSAVSKVGRKLQLGSSHIYLRFFTDFQRPTWRLNADNLDFDAGTSFIEFGDDGGELMNFGQAPLDYHKVGNAGGELTIFNEDPDQDCYLDSIVYRHGGYLQSAYRIGTLIMEPGYTYTLALNRTQQIERLEANGNCNGMIAIRSDAAGQAAIISSANDHDLTYLILRDIHTDDGGQFRALQSIDQGNNLGWTFTEGQGRTLYWVGDGGDWDDPAHWSLNSGGSGGECIPTPLDDVIFDGNSFTTPNQMVNGVNFNGYYCRDMTWTGVTDFPALAMNKLYCHGSLVFSPNMTNYLGELFMRGGGLHTIGSNGILHNRVYADGEGSYSLADPLEANQLSVNAGTFRTNDQEMTLNRISFDNPYRLATLDLGRSYVQLNSGFDGTFYPWQTPYGFNSQVIPGEATIEFTHPMAGMLGSGDIRLPGVIFTAETGLSRIVHADHEFSEFHSSLDKPFQFRSLEFANNAQIEGYNAFDTLIFSPGKSYWLEAMHIQTIGRYFQILGNNCIPIELSSTMPGSKATIQMAEGEVRGDYIQMLDQIATGGATFYAGSHSTDIGNSNQGWIFQDRPEFSEQGFFGPDRTICQGEAVRLSAFNFSPGETYAWSTGSAQEAVQVTQAGTYWARVTFANMCEIIDTVNVRTIEPAAVDLGPDSSLCQGESLILDATSAEPGVNYTWQDGSSDPTFSANQAGTYSVTLDKEGCLSVDSVTINTIDLPVVDLGSDQMLCEGEVAILDATLNQATAYEWQDGSAQATFRADQAGIYSVAVTANGCTGRDEVMISFSPAPQFSLGVDTSLCSGESLSFDFSGVGDSYAWQDGSVSSNYTINQGGQYWLSASANGCSFADTLEVAFFETPVVDLGADQELCEGENVILDVMIDQPATYEWQDGSTQSSFAVSQSGLYTVSATANGCTGRDEVRISFSPAPQFSLGPDTSLCSGESLSFDFSGVGDSYAWQDGSVSSSYTIDQGGQYWLSASANGCSFADTLEVVFFETPIVDLGADQELCEGENVLLDATIGQSATYEWQDGSTQSNLAVSQSGLYTVSATANGCTGRDEVMISFSPAPQFSLGPDARLCGEESLSFDFSGLGESYKWQDGSTSATYTISEPGLYILEIETNGCVGEDALMVTAAPAPVVELGADISLCEGESAVLNATVSQSDDFFWQDGGKESTFNVNQAGVYWVEAVLGECRTRDSLRVSIQSPPNLGLADSLALCRGESLVLRPSFTSGTAIWQDGSNLAEYTVEEEGVYSVTVDDGVCQVRDEVKVVVSSCGAVRVYVPNAFSPNDDGVNDLFFPNIDPAYQILDYQLYIYDRWGNLMFQTEDPKAGWDGLIRGRDAHPGVYVYLLQFTYDDQGVESRQLASGDVSLLR